MNEQPQNTETSDSDLTGFTRPHVSWYAFMAVSVIAVAIGGYSFWYQDHYHFIKTGLRNMGFGGAPWGMHVGFYVIFVGVSFAGIMVAATARLFHVKALQPLTRLAELVTITALIAGSITIVADLGRPFDGIEKLPRYARPQSPFYGTFTMIVAGYLFSILVYFYLAGRADAARMAQTGHRWLRWFYRLWSSGFTDSRAERFRHWRASFWLSITILPLLVIVQSTEGFIFGLQAGRPGWYSALQAPAFLILAGVSGTGALIIVALFVRRLFRLGQAIPDASFRWLGNFMWILAAVYLYFMLAEELTATYAGTAADRAVAHSIVSGAYARYFWLTVASLGACFLIPFMLYLRNQVSTGWLAVASVGGVVGAITKRLLIIVPSQTHGAQIQLEPGTYAPTLVEYGFVIGLTGLIALIILAFARVFPIVPTDTSGRPRAKHVKLDGLRIGLTSAWAVLSLAIIGVGLADSFRVWSGSEIDPRIPYSPVLFAFGVMMLFASAIVYETLPLADEDKDKDVD